MYKYVGVLPPDCRSEIYERCRCGKFQICGSDTMYQHYIFEEIKKKSMRMLLTLYSLYLISSHLLSEEYGD